MIDITASEQSYDEVSEGRKHVNIAADVTLTYG